MANEKKYRDEFYPRIGLSKIKLTVSDINDPIFINFINRNDVEFIINYGTSIYTEETLDKISIPIVNLHSGILPKYRNVHTDFWAYKNKDFKNLGITSFIINSKIDDGFILNQQILIDADKKSLPEIKIGILDLFLQEIVRLFNNPVNHPSNNFFLEEKGFWPTPSSLELYRAVLDDLKRI